MTVRIIKASSTTTSTSAEAYNLVDFRRQAEQTLASARQQADQIIAEARIAAEHEKEGVLNSARETGREEGLKEAAEEITRQATELSEAKITAQLQTALPALLAAAESLQAERDRWLVRWEQTAVRLGVAIAEKLLQRQIMARPEYASEMITNALRLAAGQPQLTVFLHPEDLSAWGDRAPEIVRSLTACAETVLVPDPTAMRGGCRIETRHGEIDARVETMLHRIAEELVEH